MRTGISITDLGPNDFNVADYIRPWRAGSTAERHACCGSVDPAGGLTPAVSIALKNIHQCERHQQNRLHPYYLVYVGNRGEIVVDHTQVKRLLDLIRSSCKGRPARPGRMPLV